MKYFIDFEATQFNHEIISIGCINEKGETFYSLVRPPKINSLTRFITELTGITKEELKIAKTSDEVFSDFFDWLSKNNSFKEFYCYGDTDISFLKKNLNDRTTVLKSQAALSIIAFSLIDYSTTVKEHFGLIKRVSLKKVFNYFCLSDNDIVEHNALSDAKMLFEIYKKINEGEEINGIPFPECMGIPTFQGNIDFEKYYIQRKVNSTIINYFNMEDAIKDTICSMSKGSQKDVKKENIKKKIIYAINHKKQYLGNWEAKIKGLD